MITKKYCVSKFSLGRANWNIPDWTMTFTRKRIAVGEAKRIFKALKKYPDKWKVKVIRIQTETVLELKA